MMRLKTAFFVFCLTLFSFVTVLAQDDSGGLPTPDTDTGGGWNPMDPPDETLPIDNHIAFLVASAVVLGGVVIYRNKIKKASI